MKQPLPKSIHHLCLSAAVAINSDPHLDIRTIAMRERGALDRIEEIIEGIFSCLTEAK